jgi:anti-anti-sigma regulatory factor
MEFKIDTKDTFTTITPVISAISAKLTGALTNNVEKLRQSGSKNFIVDLQHCTEADKMAIKDLVELHEQCYGQQESLVFTGIKSSVMTVFKEEETDLLLNIAPSMQEAIDIVSMEILERDLFSEE